MAKSILKAEYSIAAVSKLTGVSCHALRVWERRYGFPVPRRSESGHRRYGPDQVQVLRRISELVRTGQPIGELIDDVRSGRICVEEDPSDGVVSAAGSSSVPDELVSLLIAGRLSEADALFDQQAMNLASVDVILRLIEPVLIDIGERWFRRECEVFHERCVSGFFRRKLDAMLDRASVVNPRPTRTVLVGTVQGDRHQGGVLMLCLLLESIGWRAVELGVDLPVREYQRAVEAWKPDAVALSFVLSRNINKRFQELAKIRDVPVFVGGRSILNYQGLARRHGLIPIHGPISRAIPLFQEEFERWDRRHASQGQGALDAS